MKSFRIASITLVALLGLVLAMFASAPARADQGLNWKFRNSGKCMDVDNYSTADNVKIDQWTCVHQTNEEFNTILQSTNDVTYYIVNANSGKCLTVSGGYYNGAAVVQWKCVAGSNQVFTGHAPVGDSGYEVWQANANRNYCLTIAGASTANGAKLILYTCNNGTNQQIKRYNS